jgi:hypothetical protein
MGYYYNEDRLQQFSGATGKMMPVAEVPKWAVVRFGDCLWQVCESGSGGGKIELAAPDDEAHRRAGGWVGGFVGDNRVELDPATPVENLSGEELSLVEKIQRMPYGVARGQAILGHQLAVAEARIRANYPEFEASEVIRAYRKAYPLNVVCNNQRFAFAVASYAAVAPMNLDPEAAGRPLGGLSNSYVAIIQCRTSGKWVVDHSPMLGAQTCAACHEQFFVYRGANAWPEFYCADEKSAHTFDKGAGLPFDDQKRHTSPPTVVDAANAVVRGKGSISSLRRALRDEGEYHS